MPAGRSLRVNVTGVTVVSASFLAPSKSSTLVIVPSGSLASMVTDMVAGGVKEVLFVGKEIEITGSLLILTSPIGTSNAPISGAFHNMAYQHQPRCRSIVNQH